MSRKSSSRKRVGRGRPAARLRPVDKHISTTSTSRHDPRDRHAKSVAANSAGLAPHLFDECATARSAVRRGRGEQAHAPPPRGFSILFRVRACVRACNAEYCYSLRAPNMSPAGRHASRSNENCRDSLKSKPDETISRTGELFSFRERRGKLGDVACRLSRQFFAFNRASQRYASSGVCIKCISELFGTFFLLALSSTGRA